MELDGVGSVIDPPVMGTLTCIKPGPKNGAVENVALIIVGALVNALFGTNGAVPFVVPVNTNVVGPAVAPLKKTKNPLVFVICDPTTLNEPEPAPREVAEMLPLNTLRLIAPRGVRTVLLANDIGIALSKAFTAILRPIVVPVIGTVTVWLRLGEAASNIVDALRQTDKSTSFLMIFRSSRNSKSKDFWTKA